MALNYDFDMFSVGATGVPSPQETGLPPGTLVALFREPTTVAAVGRAPQSVQDYLWASNFGLGVHRSGAPAGRYPEADEAARIRVIEALAENVGKFVLPRPDDTQPTEDDFHLPSFFAALAEAEPIRMEEEPLPEAAVAEVTLPMPDDAFADDMIAADEEAPVALTAPTVADEDAAAEVVLADTAAAPDEAAPVSLFAGTWLDEDAAADANPSDAMATADLCDDMSAADEAAPDALIAAMVADEDAAADAVVADAMATADIGVDARIAEAMSADAAADDADSADAVPMPPPSARWFHLPTLPRWLTAGAAFTVLGVAFGSVMI